VTDLTNLGEESEKRREDPDLKESGRNANALEKKILQTEGCLTAAARGMKEQPLTSRTGTNRDLGSGKTTGSAAR